MTEAASVVKASTSQMESAYDQLAAATVAYTDQQVALRQTIKLLGQSEAERSIALKTLPAVLEQTTATTKALQAAKAELSRQEAQTNAALKEQNGLLLSNALAQTESAAAGGVLAASQAEVGATASLAGREMGGFLGAQIGKIAARSSALGPILSSPFLMAAPIIAGVGLVAYQFGETIYNLRKQADEAADNIDISFRKMSDGVRDANDSVLTQNDRLQQEIDNLLKRPNTNGLVIAFDEAAASADKLSVSIDSDIDKMRQLVDVGNQKNSIGFWQSLFSGKGETGDSQKLIQDQLRNIQAVNDEYSGVVQRAADSGDKADLAQAQVQQLVALQSAYKSATDNIVTSLKTITNEQDTYEESGKTFGKDQTASINMLRGALQGLADEQRNVGERYRGEQLQQKLTPMREQHTGQADNASAIRKAAEEQRKAEQAAIQGARETLESMKAVHTMTAIEESQYWAGLASTAQAGSKAYNTYLMEANRATARAQQQNTRALQQWGQEAEEQFALQIRSSNELAKQQNALASAVQQSADRITEAQAKAAQAIDEASINATEAAGGITKLSAAQEQARIHAQTYREELKRLDDEITRVNSDKALTPEQRTAQNGQLQSQKVELQGQAQVTAINDQKNIQNQLAQPYLTAFSMIDQGWLQVQNSILYSTRNIGLEFAKMGQQILISVVDNMEKAALFAMEKDLTMSLVHRQMVTQRTATDASGAAASEGISTASALKQGITAAKLAFKNTYATVSQWPYVGPILAPVLASSAFVAVAAFEDGTGYVPRDGMAYLHEGEAVVPAPTVDELRGGDGGGNVNVTQQNHFHGFDPDKEFQRKLDRNAAHVARAVQKHVRQGGRG
jgi:hypothetical protein